MIHIKVITAHGKILENELELEAITPKEVIQYLVANTLECNVNNHLVNLGNGKFVEAYDISTIEVQL